MLKYLAVILFASEAFAQRFFGRAEKTGFAVKRTDGLCSSI